MAGRDWLFSRKSEMERTEKIEHKNQKRRRKIIRTGYEPLFPVVIQFFSRMMIAAIPAIWILEAVVALEGKRPEGIAGFLTRSGYSVFYAWMILGGMTVLFCILQLIRIDYCGYEEKIYKFADEIPEKEFQAYRPVNPGEQDETLLLYAKPAEPPAEEKYRKLLVRTAAVGMGAAVYFLASFLLH